ncbi:MAG: hypothetical protein KH015_11260 [Gordonibacter pamelaeae]|uniref:Uncharacterized protein n=1 Tax=Gordonibacter pamelaeae 7-10-1-b TaxID=657308 RepID=D6EA47_9ACTN|nr:hypothetical protein [Gordonibacter pamelaeae]MBS4896335.1 hypothetical protein [Gordonibacter pamelaeae]CBL04594.1 hypothetical protein GPA_24330 [Gordonibacter pamelaeae 7-10-1-b]
MFEWLGIELDPSGLAILANPIGFFTAFSFPLMIFAAFLVSGLVGPLERLARRSERLGRLLDSAIEKGPREGWSGYILAAVTVAFLFGIALWVFCRISGS